MRANLTLSELLLAMNTGEHLEAAPHTAYAGEAVRYLPRVDEVNGHPDFYPWRVVGGGDGDRLRCGEIIVT